MPVASKAQHPAEASTARAPRSLWFAAVTGGVGAALAGAIVAIVVVSICWLPVSGSGGSAGSAIRAGLLTFLASLHAGVTLDGVEASFLPLGMTLLVGVLTWRVGSALAASAAELDETDPVRLFRAGAVQAVSFSAGCTVLASFATLGTSRVPVGGVALAALVLFALTGGAALARSSPLCTVVAGIAPHWFRAGGRIAAAVLAVYLASGALLVAASLIVHRDRVEALSAQVGGGWSGVPVLLLGVFAAPNAAIAAASYLSGPGFAVGSGSGVALGTTVHGTLPAFPILGALPSGPATTPIWLLVLLTPLLAGGVASALAMRSGTWRARWRDAGVGLVGAGVAAVPLAWQAGGAIGSGRLHTVGASPWRFGVAVAGGAGAVAVIALAAHAALRALRGERAASGGGALLSAMAGLVGHGDSTDTGVADHDTDVLRGPPAVSLVRDEAGGDKLAG